MSGNSVLKHPASGSPIVAAHSSSLRLGKCNSFIVICMVVTIFRLVSPNVPSKSNIISPLLIISVHIFAAKLHKNLDYHLFFCNFASK